ncbi:MAG: hypothetical protein IKH69_03100, partial [Bacteroidaceae bacterium]|nr:hypothetical protein [Bacteroidaceae bacterium]
CWCTQKNLRLHAAAKIALRTTLQRYDTHHAFYEYLSNFFQNIFLGIENGHDGHLVIWSFGQSRSPCQKNLHYNININIYIIVSPFDKHKNHFDQNDLDHFDHL